MLSKHEMPRDSDIKKVVKVKEEWSNLEKLAGAVEKEIAGPVKEKADKAKEEIHNFEDKLKDYY